MHSIIIKIWFSVIQYLITSPWRHNFTWNYMSRSNYVLSFKVLWLLQLCLCLWTNQTETEEKKNPNNISVRAIALTPKQKK